MQGRISKPCATRFSVEIPQGISVLVNISPYDGPDLTSDFRREVCTLEVPEGKVILRVYILDSEREKAEKGELKFWKYDQGWKDIKSIYDSIFGYLQAEFPNGDPPIAVG